MRVSLSVFWAGVSIQLPVLRCDPGHMSEFDVEDSEAVGHALTGFGINLLVADVVRSVEFLRSILDFAVLSSSTDYALLQSGNQYFQLHADHTYSQNPLPSLLPESGTRGGGIELRLFEIDPDLAEQKAKRAGYTIFAPCADKPHGLRECCLLDPDGYCWCPSRRIWPRS